MEPFSARVEPFFLMFPAAGKGFYQKAFLAFAKRGIYERSLTASLCTPKLTLRGTTLDAWTGEFRDGGDAAPRTHRGAHRRRCSSNVENVDKSGGEGPGSRSHCPRVR